MRSPNTKHASAATGWKLAARPRPRISRSASSRSSEFRTLVEERGRFLMIQSEEISDKAEGVPIHLNATNIQELIQPLGGTTVREAIAANVRAVEEQAKRTGREILVHLNHPNFGLAITAEDLADVVAGAVLRGLQRPPRREATGRRSTIPASSGCGTSPTRFASGQLKAPPLLRHGHRRHAQLPRRSRAPAPAAAGSWCESRYLSPEHLIRAIKAGRFYASSGVELAGFLVDAATKEYKIAIAAEEGVEYTTEFIGTLVDARYRLQPATDKEGKPIRATRKYSGEVGKTLATVKGPSRRTSSPARNCTCEPPSLRASPPRDPSLPRAMQQAWVQPVGWEKHVK